MVKRTKNGEDKMKYGKITGSWSLELGRFSPLHLGHISLARKILNEGGKVCFGIRDTKKDKNNPFTIKQRIEMIQKEFIKEISENKVCYVVLPDIKEIIYGRKVGWKVRQIKLDKKTESISATKIRKQLKNKSK